jgi:hypothetical protein
MWEAGLKLPTQVADGRSRCFCGAEFGIKRMWSSMCWRRTWRRSVVHSPDYGRPAQRRGPDPTLIAEVKHAVFKRT